MDGEQTKPASGIRGALGVFAIIALLCLSVFLIGEFRNSLKKFDYIGKSDQVQNMITIQGEGRAAAVPNVVKVQVGLTTEDISVDAAQKENTNKMNVVMKAMKDLKIDEKDIRTATYNISPKYQWSQGKSTIIGYKVYQAIDLKIRDTKKVSNVLKAATEKGANQIGNLDFQVDEPERIREEARVKAINQAQNKAKALAEQLGVKLGKVVSFYENSEDLSIYAKYGAEGMGGGGEVAVTPTIQMGENEIRVNVSITYEIL